LLILDAKQMTINGNLELKKSKREDDEGTPVDSWGDD
jgi:hypothetical protein